MITELLAMTLEEAERIADHPGEFGELAIREALARLTTPRIVARMRNVRTERSLQRYTDRLERLQNELETIRNQDEARRI